MVRRATGVQWALVAGLLVVSWLGCGSRARAAITDADARKQIGAAIKTELSDAKADVAAAASSSPINFIQLPVLYLGEMQNHTVKDESAFSFMPNMANSQPVGSTYFPKQYGPRNLANQDALAAANNMPNAVSVPAWYMYHRLSGDVHCGTGVKRVALPQKWWVLVPWLNP